MDRKVDMALFSANNWIDYQLASQKAAMLGLRQAISETKKAYKIQDKQSPSEGFEAFTIEDTAEIYALLVGAESAIESAISKLEEAKSMMTNFERERRDETSN